MKGTVREYKREARERLRGKFGLLVGAQILSNVFVYGIALLAVAALLIGIGGTMGFKQYRSGSMLTETASSLSGLSAMTSAFGASFAILFAVLLLLTLIAAFLLSIGMTKLWLNICRGRRYGIGDLFYGLRKGSHPFRYLGVGALQILFILGAYILLVIGLVALIAGMDDSAGQMGAVLVLTLVWTIWFCFIMLGFSFAGLLVIDQPETRVLQAFSRSWRMMKKKRLKFLWLNLSFIFWSIPNYLSFGVASLWIDPYIGFAMIGFYLDAEEGSGLQEVRNMQAADGELQGKEFGQANDSEPRSAETGQESASGLQDVEIELEADGEPQNTEPAQNTDSLSQAGETAAQESEKEHAEEKGEEQTV